MSLGQENLTTKINDSGLGLTFHEPRKQNGAASWEEALEHSTTQFQSVPFPLPVSSTPPANMMGIPNPENVIIGQLFTEDCSIKQDVVASSKGQVQWQVLNFGS